MKRWSALPLYAVAVTWILWAWLLPLYNLLHYALLILLSAGVYAGFAAVCNRRKTEKDGKGKSDGQEPEKQSPEKQERKSTGNPELDKLILDRDRAVSEMRRLNDNIPDEALSAQIDDLEATTTRIIDHVLEHPEKLPQIRKFMNYYLPTTLKLLNVYDRMGEQGVREENISSTMERVEDTFGRIVQAYHKQLDALFADEALDVSTDITVMENLLRQEGFIGGDSPASPFGAAAGGSPDAAPDTNPAGTGSVPGAQVPDTAAPAGAENPEALAPGAEPSEAPASGARQSPASPFGEQRPVPPPQKPQSSRDDGSARETK